MDEHRGPRGRPYGLMPEGEGNNQPEGYSGGTVLGALALGGAIVGGIWVGGKLLSGDQESPMYANESVHVIQASEKDCPETMFGRKFLTFDNAGDLVPASKGKYVEVLAFHDHNGNGEIDQYDPENKDAYSDPVYLFKFQSLQNDFGSEAHKAEIAEHIEKFKMMMGDAGKSSTFHISTRPPGTAIPGDVTIVDDLIPVYTITTADGKKEYKNVRVIVAPFNSIVYDGIVEVNGYLKDIAEKDDQIELLQGQIDNASALYNDFVNASAADRGRIAAAINSAITEFGVNGSIESVAPHDPEGMVKVLAYINEALDNAWSGDYDSLSNSSATQIDGLNSSLLTTEADRKKLKEERDKLQQLRERLKADLAAYGVDINNATAWFDGWKAEKADYRSKIDELGTKLKTALDNSAALKKDLNDYLSKNPVAYDYHSQLDKVVRLDNAAKAETDPSEKSRKELRADLEAAELGTMVDFLKKQNLKENNTIDAINNGLNRRKPRDSLPKTKKNR